MTSIEQLRKETNEITNSLKELKDNVSLSEVEKKNKAEALKTQAETTKKKIEKEIHSLENKTDDESKKKKEEAEALLNTFNETVKLYASVLASSETKSQNEDSKEKTGDEEKWFFKKTWEWISDTWSKIPGRWKVVTGWIWAAIASSWLIKKFKKRFWKDKKKEESANSDSPSEEKSFWEGTVWKTIKTVWGVLAVWSVWYYVAHWLYTKNWWRNDLRDREKGKKLEFDVALEYCKWAISNQDNMEWMAYGMDLKYHEDTWEIEAYWEKIKIDKNNRKIEWLNVGFKKYEHMINTAIIVAYLKKNYAWKCVNNSPFDLNWSWQWDINVATQNGGQEALDWTWNWGRITWIWTAAVASIITAIWSKNVKLWASVLTAWWALWFAWWYVYDTNNIMNKHMPELDDENWRKNLTAYLNSMACRKARNQGQEDIAESPIKDKVRECIDEIQRENPELPSRWGRRQFDMIKDPNDKDKYTIKVYGREISAEVKWTNWNEKIKILWISWWNPKIKTDMSKWDISNLELPLKEWIYMTSLLWFLLDTFHHKWNEYPRFKYDRKAAKLITTWFWLWWNNNWIYFSDSGINTYALSWEKFEKRMPTLFKENHGERFIKFLNDWIMDEDNISIWKKLEQ